MHRHLVGLPLALNRLEQASLQIIVTVFPIGARQLAATLIKRQLIVKFDLTNRSSNLLFKTGWDSPEFLAKRKQNRSKVDRTAENHLLQFCPDAKHLREFALDHRFDE